MFPDLPTSDDELEVAALVPCTEAEGPHRRVALWVQGCSLRCPGCCNPELFERGRGRQRSVHELLDAVHRARIRERIEGITVLGGEPMEQIVPLTHLCEGVQAMGLGVIVFTGLRWAEARRLRGFDRLWSAVDTLVDGRYDPRRVERRRRFIGSANQRLFHRTARYRDPDLWLGPNHAEVRIDKDGSVSVHGFPDRVRGLLRVLPAARP